MQGEYEEAESLHRRAMEITEAAFGKDHPEYSTRLNNFAQLLKAQVRGGMLAGTLGAEVTTMHEL